MRTMRRRPYRPMRSPEATELSAEKDPAELSETEPHDGGAHPAGSVDPGGPDDAAEIDDPDDTDGTVLDFPETDHQSRLRRRRMGMVAGGTVLVLLIALVAVLYFSSVLAVRTVEVSGTDLLPRERAEQLLEPLLGEPLPQIGTGQVEELVAGEPAVDEVRIQAQPPSTVAVEVTEHEPVAQVVSGDQARLYSAAGEQLATVSAEDAASRDLPRMASAEDVAEPEVFAAITEVLGTLPPEIGSQLDSASARSVDSVTLTLQDGRAVLWGNPEQAERKTTVLRALLQAEAQAEVPATEYDVSTPDEPVTR